MIQMQCERIITEYSVEYAILNDAMREEGERKKNISQSHRQIKSDMHLKNDSDLNKL